MATAQEKAAQEAADAAAADAAAAAEAVKASNPVVGSNPATPADGVPSTAPGAESADVEDTPDAKAGTYELLAGTYTETTSKPGEPFTYRSYVRGDKIRLNKVRAAELIADGAVKDPNADGGNAELGAETQAPKGPASRRNRR